MELEKRNSIMGKMGGFAEVIIVLIYSGKNHFQLCEAM